MSYGDMRLMPNSVCVAGMIHVSQTNSLCLGNMYNTFLHTVQLYIV